MKQNHYPALAIMTIISFVIMYGVMFLNVDASSHIYLSTTRTYMALLMVCPMVLLMLLVMPKMYPRKSANIVIGLVSVAIFALALAGLRTQTPVDDIQYMKAMIPHHSSAIMTSKHANIHDAEVKALSEQIIRSQEEEIAQMKAILARMH